MTQQFHFWEFIQRKLKHEFNVYFFTCKSCIISLFAYSSNLHKLYFTTGFIFYIFHLTLCFKCSLLCVQKSTFYSIVCLYYILFLHSHTYRHLNCLQFSPWTGRNEKTIHFQMTGI